MDFKMLRDRKRQELDELAAELQRLTARVEPLEEEVATLDRAILIAEREGVALTVGAPGGQAPTKPRRSNERRRRPEKRAKQADRSLIDAIRSAVQQIPPPFKTGLVRQHLQEAEPAVLEGKNQSSLAGTMRRMAEIGELVVVEKGGPGKEATYRLPEKP